MRHNQSQLSFPMIDFVKFSPSIFSSFLRNFQFESEQLWIQLLTSIGKKELTPLIRWFMFWKQLDWKISMISLICSSKQRQQEKNIHESLNFLANLYPSLAYGYCTTSDTGPTNNCNENSVWAFPNLRTEASQSRMRKAPECLSLYRKSLGSFALNQLFRSLMTSIIWHDAMLAHRKLSSFRASRLFLFVLFWKTTNGQ